VRNYFGIEVTELSIDGKRGNCRFRVPKGDLGLLQNIAGSLAGRIAEDRMGGFTNEAEWKASGDYGSAFDCALKLSAGDKVGAEMLLQWAERRTEKPVEKLWPKIHALAFKLLDSVDNNGVARLTGEEIREAIGKVKVV
jgi:hypothetical protein